MTGISRSPEMPAAAPVAETNLRSLALYFLKLGAVGFGGPIALAERMYRELVEGRNWFSHSEYTEGLSFSQLAPGPLAAQLAMYLGWLRGGAAGATLAGAAFILPSFAMVVALAVSYQRLGQAEWIQAVFYGVGAAVTAIIVRSAGKLLRVTLKRDPVLWTIAAAMAATTAWTGMEIVWLFVLCGVGNVLIRARAFCKRIAGNGLCAASAWPLAVAAGPATPAVTLFLFFLKAGAFVFGSGLAIVPFLYGGVVREFHWLTEREFLDAVAVAMITPGPVVIAAGFIGYLVAGFLGATLACAGVFAPPWLLVIVGAPLYRRFAENPQVRAFVQGVTSAAVGAIAGAAFILGKRAIVDWPTLVIAGVSLALLLGRRKVPDPAVILAAGVVGLLIWKGH